MSSFSWPLFLLLSCTPAFFSSALSWFPIALWLFASKAGSQRRFCQSQLFLFFRIVFTFFQSFNSIYVFLKQLNQWIDPCWSLQQRVEEAEINATKTKSFKQLKQVMIAQHKRQWSKIGGSVAAVAGDMRHSRSGNEAKWSSLWKHRPRWLNTTGPLEETERDWAVRRRRESWRAGRWH